MKRETFGSTTTDIHESTKGLNGFPCPPTENNRWILRAIPYAEKADNLKTPASPNNELYIEKQTPTFGVRFQELPQRANATRRTREDESDDGIEVVRYLHCGDLLRLSRDPDAVFDIDSRPRIDTECKVTE